MTGNELITWFWHEFEEHPFGVGGADGLCQCGTEKVIEQSHKPTQMRSFFMISVFLDQMVHTHYQNIYGNFRSIFRFPKLYSHGGVGMASPSWFVYSYHKYDEKMDWQSAHDVAQPMVFDFLTWLEIETESEATIEQFMSLAKQEVNWEFEGHTAPRFWELLNSAVPKIASKVGTELFD
jgi:hypothetical protein